MNRFQELKQKEKEGKLSDEERAELLKMSTKKSNRKDRRVIKEKKTKEFVPGNDFSWWSKIPELLKDAANYKCNYVAGNSIAGTDIPFVIPGVALIKLLSTYGNNVAATDAINVWARDLYLRMFQKYRPASGYSASDLGITLIAALEVVKLIAKYERIYGVINRYSVLNTNMPLVEASALGLSTVTVTYLQSHLSDFRYDLNFLVRKAQRLCIPKDISAIADAISLFGYEYLDHDNARGQIIMFDTDYVGVYSDTDLSTGGSINFKSTTSGSYQLIDTSADNMCVALDKALQALIGSDSVQRIFADLIVWFGQEAMLQFMPIPEEYVVIPVYSESILHKMHNLETFNNASFDLVSWADSGLPSADISTVTNGSFYVYQVDDRIVTKCGVKRNGSGTNTPHTVDGGTILMNNASIITPCSTNAHVLDTYRVDVNEETITEGILFKNHSRIVIDTTDGYVTMLDSCAFYIAHKVELYTNGIALPLTLLLSSGTLATVQANAGILSILDWAPLAYMYVQSGVLVTPTAIFGDLDSVVPMYGNGITKLQRTVLLSGLHTDVKTVGSSK